jgi:hypothetical protein
MMSPDFFVLSSQSILFDASWTPFGHLEGAFEEKRKGSKDEEEVAKERWVNHKDSKDTKKIFHR